MNRWCRRAPRHVHILGTLQSGAKIVNPTLCSPYSVATRAFFHPLQLLLHEIRSFIYQPVCTYRLVHTQAFLHGTVVATVHPTDGVSCCTNDRTQSRTS